MVAYESFWSSVWLRYKMVTIKVVAYGSWLLTRSDRYERVDMHSFHADMNKSTIFAIMNEAIKFPGKQHFKPVFF